MSNHKNNQAAHNLITASEVLLVQSKNSALAWANEMLTTNPAYHKYLMQLGFTASALSSYDDFSTLPLIDKHFLREQLPSHLCADSAQIYTFSTSSGMTGEPVLIPRRKDSDAAVLMAVDNMWKDNWDIDKKSTLTITGWALGMWVAGPLMLNAGTELTKKYDLIAIHPGSDVQETAKLIMELHKMKSQIILQGYPPYVAEVINELANHNLDLPSLNLNLFIAGEPMSENWRIVMQKLLAGPQGEHDLSRVISLYGTAEGGIMAFETRLSILIRKLAYENPDVAQSLFGSTKTVPMLFQYPPQSKWLEEINHEIVFTGKTGIPSVRYNMHDEGGVITFKQMFDQLDQLGYHPLDTLDKLGYSQKPNAPLPFVYVFGRSDGGVSIDGGNIYPSDIDALLNHTISRELGVREFMLDIAEDYETGKMKLLIHLQLHEGLDPQSIDHTQFESLPSIIADILAANNPDYRKSVLDNPASATPAIKIHHYTDPLFERNQHLLKRTRETARTRT